MISYRLRFFKQLINFLLLFALFFLVSCATTKKYEEEISNGNVSTNTQITNNATVQNPSNEGSILSLPGKTELAKKRLDSELILNIEKGSPLSLKTALLYIKNDSKGLTEYNKIYLKIIDDIMRTLYPLENKKMVETTYNGENPLLKGLSMVKNGEYPQLMKKDSFLGIIIPTMILAVQKNKKNYQVYITDIYERLNEAKKLYPQSVLPYYFFGILSENDRDFEKATKYYKQAWELDNSCYPAGFKYADLSAEMGNGGITIAIADVLNKFYSDNMEINTMYAKGHIANGNFEKASDYIFSILKREPENLSALLLRVRILIEKKEYLKANALLDAYSTKNKTSRDYLLFRSRISQEWNKNLNSAIGFLNSAYSLYPEDFKVLLSCAEICFNTSQKIDNNDADFFIQKVLNKEPENILALSLLVKNNINSQNWQKAISLALKLNNKSSSELNKQLLIEAYLGGKEYSKALNLSEQLFFAKKNPNIELTKLYTDSLFYLKNYTRLTKEIDNRMSSADSKLKSLFYYYKAKMGQSNSEIYLSLLRSSLLSNPRNQSSLFAMYEWYFNSKDYRKAKYYLGQVIALDPLNKKIVNLSKNLDRLLAD